MFEVPGAKRVRRDEILSRTSTSRSPSPPPDLAETSAQDGHQRLAKLLNLDSLLTGVNANANANADDKTSSNTSTGADGQNGKQEGQDDDDEEQEFEFRLFSAPAAGGKSAGERDGAQRGDDQSKPSGEKKETTTQKLRIRLRSPTPGPADLSEGRFVKPFRGWEYYFTVPGLLTGSEDIGAEDANLEMKRRQFEEVAVTGQNVMNWASVPWPGCHLPWRVIHLKRHRTKSQRKADNSSTSTAAPVVYVPDPNLNRTPTTRKKPGKKRRVQLRKRLEAAETAKLEDAEKRTRKNRERKIKRRQKNRDMKAAAGGETADDGDVAMADDASSEGDD